MRARVSKDLTNIIIQSQKLIPKAEDEFLEAFNKNNKNLGKSITLSRFDKTKGDNLDIDSFFGRVEDNGNKTDTTQRIESEDYYDFKTLNKRKFEKLEKDKLNRTFPNEIENIQKIKETNYVLSKLNLSNNKDDQVSISNINGTVVDKSYGQNSHRNSNDKENSLNMTIHPLLENKPIHQEDIIESYSMVKDIQDKLIDDIPFYRELAPYSREVVYSKSVAIF